TSLRDVGGRQFVSRGSGLLRAIRLVGNNGIGAYCADDYFLCRGELRSPLRPLPGGCVSSASARARAVAVCGKQWYRRVLRRRPLIASHSNMMANKFYLCQYLKQNQPLYPLSKEFFQTYEAGKTRQENFPPHRLIFVLQNTFFSTDVSSIFCL
ncbi:MAG: hypothetical protein AAGU77_13155, partial [Bacillota bacterium]